MGRDFGLSTNTELANECHELALASCQVISFKRVSWWQCRTGPQLGSLPNAAPQPPRQRPHAAMGVHGLWKILEPVHRPVKLETLARKRLAVDASIWIYQFLKAVRDADGNALHNSHIVGFFRRICKLLFHGIRPVFVFDGGAPVLKRQTIAERKQRREGRREDAAQTAKKLLALQIKKLAEEEAEVARGYGF